MERETRHISLSIFFCLIISYSLKSGAEGRATAADEKKTPLQKRKFPTLLGPLLCKLILYDIKWLWGI